MKVPLRGNQVESKEGAGWCRVKKKKMRRNDKHWRNLRLNAFRERAAPLTKRLCALIQITARPGRPRGESTFLHLIVRPWNPIPFFQMASEATDLASLASFDPPNDPVQPKQPSHYWLQLFGTGNLIPVSHWRPICEVVWWKSLPLLWPQFFSTRQTA